MRIIFLFGLIFFLSGCQAEDKVLRFTGETMGTTYNVVVMANHDVNERDLHTAIRKKLAKVNKHLSNWDPNSEISRFNALKTPSEFVMSKMLRDVMVSAMAVHTKSNGSFDITLGPLINLWGFGSKGSKQSIPTDHDISSALSKVGQNTKLVLDHRANTLLKKDVDIQANLSAIAKGFGVDEVAETLRDFGIKSYMVEIGGDLFAQGQNPKGQKWQIGIEHPDPKGRDIQLITKVTNLGMATSGDYRNYFEKDGIRYSHILNVKTGRPVTHKTASVTVLAENAMLADAWATALLALGEVEGMKIAKKNNLAAFFIFRSSGSKEVTFSTLMSPRFAELHAKQ